MRAEDSRVVDPIHESADIDVRHRDTIRNVKDDDLSAISLALVDVWLVSWMAALIWAMVTRMRAR
jgi:hypothetical protein